MKHINIFSSVSEYETAKSGGTLITPNVSFINESAGIICLPKLEDPYNGYEYVDLGLPSGLKWATCNIGASSPEKAGLYFAWGETTGYTADQITNSERLFTQDVYNAGPAASIETDLTLEQDAAHVNMGGNWRMPTKTEYKELIDNCNVVWTDDYNGTGVKGRIFTSKVNGNSVLFSTNGYCQGSSVYNVGLTGYFWSASYESSLGAHFLFFNFGIHMTQITNRYSGHNVRAVCE